MRGILYFLSFVSILWLLYRSFRLLFFAPPPFMLAVTLRLGLALLIFLGAVNLPRNLATFDKQFKETVGYPSSLLTMRFIHLDEVKKQRIMREAEIYFSDIQNVITVENIPTRHRTESYLDHQRRIKIQQDILPNRYRWQGDQLTIASGRPLTDEEAARLEATLTQALNGITSHSGLESRFVLSPAMPGSANLWQILLAEETDTLALTFSASVQPKVFTATCPKNMTLLCSKARFFCLLPVATTLPDSLTTQWLQLNHDEPIKLTGSLGQEKYQLWITKEREQIAPFLVLSSDNMEVERERFCQREKRNFMMRHFSQGTDLSQISQSLESFKLERNVRFHP